jgi:hypothetical protein
MFHRRHQIVARWSSAHAIIAPIQRAEVLPDGFHRPVNHCNHRITSQSMISAHPIRSVRVVAPARGALRPALQAERCSEALIELCGRIWLELEHLAHLNSRSRTPEDSSLDLAAETLRLELLLIMDACESSSWVFMLDPDVRHRLFAMSRDVLAILAVGPNELTLGVIECAQDRVFDEALIQNSLNRSMRQFNAAGSR